MLKNFFQTLALGALVVPILAESNSTKPDGINSGEGRVGWVSPEAQRSTWDIIWSCLSIFIICSWKCVHLNLPTPEEARGEWYKADLHWFKAPILPKWPLWRKWGRKAMWMGIISIAPELGIALAVKQFKDALQDSQFEDGLTISHAFFAQMGGLAIYDFDLPRLTSPAKAESQSDNREERGKPEDEAQDLGWLKVIEGNRKKFGDDQPLDEDFHYVDSLGLVQKLNSLLDTLRKLANAADANVLDVINVPTKDDIERQSKADAFTKVFALVQSTWLVVQSIARVHQRLAISQLELATIAFVVCALAMYGFWWYKPFNVERPQLLTRVRQPSGSHRSFGRYGGLKMYQFRDRQRIHELSYYDFLNLTVNDMAFEEHIGSFLPSIALYLGGMVFSAIHLAAWNWEFPSPLIQSLWRWFCVVALAASLLPFIIYPLGRMMGDSRTDFITNTMRYIGMGVSFAALVAYIIARLAILVLIFYCFSSLPASTYERVDWTGYIPHFS